MEHYKLKALIHAYHDKWKPLSEGRGKDDGGSDCACCQMTTLFSGSGKVDCNYCPIKDYTGKSDCNMTPYQNWDFKDCYIEYLDNDDTNEFKRQAKAEADFLLRLIMDNL